MNWPTVLLTSVSSLITKGTTPTTLGKSYVSSGIPFLRAENLQNKEITLGGNLLFIDEETESLLGRSIIKPNDILISIAGTIGRVGLVPEGAPRMNCNQAVAIVRPTTPLQSRFLMYWLMGWDAATQMAGSKVTQTISNLSLGQIGNLKLPLPSSREQSRIVELLDEADRLRRLRREADAKAARILPALFLKMFGDPARNPMGWSLSSFANTFDDTTAGNEKLQSSQFMEAGKIAVVDQGQSQIAGYCDDVSIAYRGQLPAIVFGDHTRIFKFIDHPFVLGADGVRVLTPKPKFNPLFAYWHCKLLNIPSAGYSRHFKYLKEKSFICPDEDLQNRFSDLTQTVMSQTAVLEKAAAGVEQIFSVLLENAFSGQLTAEWRKGHLRELLAEMAQQAHLLNLPMPEELEALP